MAELNNSNELAKLEKGTLDKRNSHLSIGQLETILLTQFPREDACEWDRTGLVVGDQDLPIKRVAIALDPTKDAILNAAENGANLLLSHHPVFLDEPESFYPYSNSSNIAGECVYQAISHGVSLMNFHTALDVSIEATRLYSELLNLDFVRILEPLKNNKDKGFGIYCSATRDLPDITLANFSARVTSVFGKQPRVWGDFNNHIRNICIANGSANSMVDAAIESKCDCLLCGEIGYHNALGASSNGLSIIEIGHDVSEFPLCAILANSVRKAGIPDSDIFIIDQSQNWNYPEAIRI